MKTHSVRFIVCPACGQGEDRVEHLFGDAPRDFGPWYCDECGKAYSGTAHPDGRLDVEVDPRLFKKKTRVLLKRGNLHLEVEGMWFTGRHNDSTTVDSQRYYYEEGTCPTNYMGAAVEVFEDGESDPHGLFEYVETRPEPDDPDQSAFPELATPEPAPSGVFHPFFADMQKNAERLADSLGVPVSMCQPRPSDADPTDN